MQISDYLQGEWKQLLQNELRQPYFQQLQKFLSLRVASGAAIYPSFDNIFTALNSTPPLRVKAVLIGQDPYHGPGQAHGLAFSVSPGVPLPPSLVNIYRELESDLGIAPAFNGCLSKWANQGVLLLNTVLTVEKSSPGSHSKKGWEEFTDSVIQKASQTCPPSVFLLWGKPAQKKIKLIDPARHCILQAPHPSPLSAYRGFLGCRHFSKANDFLSQQGRSPIDWCLE